ncbi:hypothetical protein Tco_0266233 [Tanacetum coccineum]
MISGTRNKWANYIPTSIIVLAREQASRKTSMILGLSSNGLQLRTGKKKLCKADLESSFQHLVKAFLKTTTIKGIETRKVVTKDAREEAKTSFTCNREKTTVQEDLSKLGKALLEGRIRDIDTEHPSETKVLHNEDGNPARANIKQALGSYERSHKGVKASANSDIVYFFTSAQDGDPLQDDVRLCLGDDLKKAQDHNQRQVKDESKDHYPKCTRYQMSTS